MKNNRRIIAYVIYIVLGIALLVLSGTGAVDAFWGGMGTAFLAVAVLRLVWMYRYAKDENYRETVEIEKKDERNHFLRSKAWAWAGYLFILIAAVLAIGMRLAGQELLSVAAGTAVSLMVLLYWGSLLVLRRKY